MSVYGRCPRVKIRGRKALYLSVVMADIASKPKQYGMIICYEYDHNLVDELSGGKLRKFLSGSMEFFNSLDNIEDAEEDEREEIREFHEEELNEALMDIFESAWLLGRTIPMENRYDPDTRGALIGIYGSVFMKVEGVLKDSATLILAIGQCRDSCRFAQDVMQKGVSDRTMEEYGGHWKTPELLAKARAGLASLRCDEVVAVDSSLPWDKTSERTQKWLAFPARPTLWLDEMIDPEDLETRKAKKRSAPKKQSTGKRAHLKDQEI